MEITVGYCSRLGSWQEAFISIPKNQKYHGEELPHRVLATNGTGLLWPGEAGQTLAWRFDAYGDAQSAVC